MSDGLARQRRNLLAVSVILVFVKFAGVKIEELVFLGINFGTLENPQAIYLGIWLVFLYFAIRYYQYYMQEGRSRLHNSLNAFVEPKLQKIGRDICREIAEDASYEPANLSALRFADWTFKITYKDTESSLGDSSRKVRKVRLTKTQRINAYLSSAIYVVLNRSEASDFILPFIVAFGALIYCFSGSESGLMESLSAIKGT